MRYSISMKTTNVRPDQHTRRLRGRPRDSAKRAALIESAVRQFVQQGYNGTSMETVAREAGVSKVTLYRHFGSKAKLFQAAVDAHCEAYTPAAIFTHTQEQTLAAQLLTIGDAFTRLVLDDDALAAYQLIVTDARRDGRAGGLFYAAGPRRTISAFASFLRAADTAGQLQVGDAEQAAGHFFCLLKGLLFERVLVGERRRISKAERLAHVADVVAVFLRAYRPG